MNLSEQLNEAHKVTEAKAIPLPDVKFELVGFGKDTNGNSIAKFKSGKGKGFSIQTNGNLPATHSIKISGKKAKELNTKELATIADETKLYIEANGTQKMRESITVEEILGEASNEGKNTEVVKIKVTDSNNNKIQQLFKKAKNNVLDGEIKDATYQAYLTGVKKDSLGTLNVEIESFVDSSTMKKKFKKEILSKIGISESLDSENTLSLSEQYMDMSEKKTQHKTVVVSSNDKGISSKHFNNALKHLKANDGESTDKKDKGGDLAPLLVFKLDLSGPVGATFTSAKLMDDSRIVFKNVTIDESIDEVGKNDDLEQAIKRADRLLKLDAGAREIESMVRSKYTDRVILQFVERYQDKLRKRAKEEVRLVDEMIKERLDTLAKHKDLQK
jgi:hypothetical protein